MLGRRGRLSFRFMRKRNRLLFEAGVGILLVIVFFGALNAIVVSNKEPIVTTVDLWNNGAKLYYGYINSTSGVGCSIGWVNLTDYATFYDGYIYITIPDPPAGCDQIKYIDLRYDGNLTWNDLVNRGFNYIDLYAEFDNKTSISPSVRIFSTSSPDTLMSYTGMVPSNTSIYVVNASESVDTGAIAVKLASSGAGSGNLLLYFGELNIPTTGLDYIKVKLTLYAASKRPLLAGLTEPIAGVFSAMYTAILGAFRRVKNYAATMFGGWLSGFTFTGLIGDPMTALVVSVVIITVVYWIHKR